MDAYQIIEYIRTSPKKTPVRVWLQTSQPVAFPAAQQFSGGNGFSVVFGDWEDIRPVLEENREKILSQQVENDASYYPRAGTTRRQCSNYEGSGYQYRRGNRRRYHD